MSAKREKQVRRIARSQYGFIRDMWLGCKPPRWRIFKYMKWQKSEPKYQHYEKLVKNTAKRKVR